MNVNLQPVSSTTQVSRSGSDVATANSSLDAEDSKGFLQTLSEVFSSGKGEKSQAVSDKESVKGDASSAQPSSSATAEGEQALETKGVQPDSGVDEVLELASESDQESVSSAAKGQSAESESTTLPSGEEKLSHSVSAENAKGELTAGIGSSTEQASFNQQSKQTVMQEGSQILGQLEQSNAALKEPSGKALPQSPETELAEQASQRILGESSAAPLSPSEFVAPQGKPVPHYSAHLEQQALVQPQPIDDAMRDAKWVNPVGMSNVTTANNAAHWSAQQANPTTVDGALHLEPSALMMEQATGAASVGVMVGQGASLSQTSTAEAVPLAQLMVIEQKLENLQPLNQAEQQMIEGLKTGQLVADIPQTEFIASLPALSTIALPHTKALDASLKEGQAPIPWNTTPLPEHKLAVEAKGQEASLSKSASSALVAQAAQSALNQANTGGANPALVAEKAMSALPDGINPNAIPSAFTMGTQPEMAKSQTQSLQAALSAAGLAAVKNSARQSTDGESTTSQATSSGYSATHLPSGQARAEQVAAPPSTMSLSREMAHEQVAEKVQMMMSKNLKQLDIRLDPPELGRMQIRMTMNNDVANVHFTVANPQAREMIEQTLPRLREMLAQQGMQLADSSVQQQASGQQQRQYSADGQGQGQQSGRFASGGEENLEADVKLDLNVTSKRDGISFYA